MADDTGTPLPRIGAPATRALTAAGFRTLESLAGADAAALLALHGVGPKALRIIEESLVERGLPVLARRT